jgi:Tfp pilus assembly protein PilZ
MGDDADRRRESRHPLQMDVIHGSVTIGIAENVSRHGLLMNCVEDLSVGEEIALSIELGPEHALPVTGTVTWQQPTNVGYQIGIEVTEPTPAWISLVGEIEGRSRRRNAGDQDAPRSAPRIPARLPARFGHKSANEERGYIRDIAPGGIGLEGSLDVNEGDVVFIKFDVPTGESADLIGNVVWCSEEDGARRIGVKLQSANEGYYRLLARFSSVPPAHGSDPSIPSRPPDVTPSPPPEEVFQLLDDMRSQDPFTLLGIEPTDDEESIEQGFFATVRRLNPTRLSSGPDAEILAAAKEMFSLVSAAHRLLKDPGERAQLLAALKPPPAAAEPREPTGPSPEDLMVVPVSRPIRKPR